MCRVGRSTLHTHALLQYTTLGCNNGAIARKTVDRQPRGTGARLTKGFIV